LSSAVLVAVVHFIWVCHLDMAHLEWVDLDKVVVEVGKVVDHLDMAVELEDMVAELEDMALGKVVEQEDMVVDLGKVAEQEDTVVDLGKVAEQEDMVVELVEMMVEQVDLVFDPFAHPSSLSSVISLLSYMPS